MKLSSHLEYRPDIDGLRGIAILSVVLFHAFPFPSNPIQGGFVGVDIFFVISGYLISRILIFELKNGSFSIRDFYIRRIRRIFPALIVVLCSCFILGWFFLLANEYMQLGLHIRNSTTFTNNFLLLSESGYFDNASATKPLLHLWSLSIEEQFYIFWPCVLWIAFRKNINLIFLLFLLFFLSFTMHFQKLHLEKEAAFYLTHLRMWELLIGALIANLTINSSVFIYHIRSVTDRILTKVYLIFPFKFDRSMVTLNFISFFGLFLIICGFFIISKAKLFPGLWALIFPVLGTSLLISSTRKSWVNKKVLSSKIFVWTGLISYPLYLWHWPLLSIAQIANGGIPSRELRIFIVLISFVLAFLTYFFVEKPIRKNKFNNIKIWTLILLMFLLGGIGQHLFIRDGYGFRFDRQLEEIKKLSQITNVYEFYNYNKFLRSGLCHSVPLKTSGLNGCLDRREKNLVLWGDSYAATLYGGLENLRNAKYKQYGIQQLTDGSGPPFFADGVTDDNRYWANINEDKLNYVRQYKPDIILLSCSCDSYGFSMEFVSSEIKNTILKIKDASPSSKIIFIGPFPRWHGSLIKQLIKAYQLKLKAPSKYMNDGLYLETQEWDNYLKNNLKKLNIVYISPLDFFCNQNGCMTRVHEDVLDLTAIDWGHFTNSASIYFMAKIDNYIFNNPHKK